jgi:anti-anti-sigma factor
LLQSALARRHGSYRNLWLRVAASSDRVNSVPERACALRGEHPDLEVVEVREHGRIRVRLLGELDLAGVPLVSACLRGHSARGDAVLLDLDELDFMDMSGLRLLLSAAEDASRDGWGLALTRGSPQVRRIIELVHLDGRLPYDGSST